MTNTLRQNSTSTDNKGRLSWALANQCIILFYLFIMTIVHKVHNMYLYLQLWGHEVDVVFSGVPGVCLDGVSTLSTLSRVRAGIL